MKTIYKPTLKQGKQTIYRSIDPDEKANTAENRKRALIFLLVIVVIVSSLALLHCL